MLQIERSVVPKLLVGLETWGHKLAASLSELVLQNKVGASGAEFSAEKNNLGASGAELVPENKLGATGAEFGAGKYWCRI